MIDETSSTPSATPEPSVVEKIEKLNGVLSQVRGMLESQQGGSDLQSEIEKNISEEVQLKMDQFQIRLDQISEEFDRFSPVEGDQTWKNDFELKFDTLREQFQQSLEDFKAEIAESKSGESQTTQDEMRNEFNQLIDNYRQSTTENIQALSQHSAQQVSGLKSLTTSLEELQRRVESNESKLNSNPQDELRLEFKELIEQNQLSSSKNIDDVSQNTLQIEGQMSILKEQFDGTIKELRVRLSENEAKLNDDLFDDLRDELKHLVEQYHMASSNEIKELTQNSSEIKSVQQRLFDELQGRLNNLQSDINSTQVGMEHMRHQIGEQEESLENSMAVMKRESNEVNERNERTLDRVSRATPILEQQISSALQDIQGLREQFENSESRAHQFENEITQLKEVLNTLREETGSFQHKMFEDFKLSNDTLAQQLHARATGLETDLQRDHEALKTMTNTVKEEMGEKLTAAKDHLLVLHKEIEDLNEGITAEGTRIKEMKLEHEQSSKETKDNKNEIRLINNRINEYQNAQNKKFLVAALVLFAVGLIYPLIPSSNSQPPANENNNQMVAKVDTPTTNNAATVAEVDTFTEPPISLDDNDLLSSDGEETDNGDELFVTEEFTSEESDTFELEDTSDRARITEVAFARTEESTEAPEEPEVQYVEYVVKKGESLWTIAKKHYKNPLMYKKIQADNKMSSSDIKPGVTLRIYH